SDKFFDYLRRFRFTGEVWAIPEGTPVFQEEPLLRVTAPIIEGQIVETYLLSMITFQTMIASKAARVVRAAQGRSVIEFGTRRAHSPEAGTLGARAAYIGGCIGTSNVETGRRFGIPTFGTLAHSFVMAYDDEEEAFRRFQNIFPDHATLLVDTYDTLAAIDKIIQAELRPKAVRLDSGDVVELSRAVRQRLDEAGLTDTQIFATSDLDDVVAHCSENYAEAEPLLVCVMRDGEHLAGSPRIQQVRERAQLELAKLPEECHRLDQARPYPVRFSRELQRLMEDFRSRFAQ